MKHLTYLTLTAILITTGMDLYAVRDPAVTDEQARRTAIIHDIVASLPRDPEPVTRVAVTNTNTRAIKHTLLFGGEGAQKELAMQLSRRSANTDGDADLERAIAASLADSGDGAGPAPK